MYLLAPTSTRGTRGHFILEEGLGFTSFRTILDDRPSGGVSFVLVWVNAFGAVVYLSSRFVVGIFVAMIPSMGTLLLLFLPVSNILGYNQHYKVRWVDCSSPERSRRAHGIQRQGHIKKLVMSAICIVF